MSDDQKSGPSTLMCALAGLGGATAVCGVMYLFGRKDEKKFGALQGAAGELRQATDAYDAAFRRLMDAEEALEAVKAASWNVEEDQWGVAVMPRLRAAHAEVKAAKAAADAARNRMSEWSEVVRLERKPATTEAGREAQRLLNELEDLFQPSRGN